MQTAPKTPRIKFAVRILAVILCLSIGLSGVVIPARAATFTVCAAGCDFTTIQDAIDDAAVGDGDTIYVGAGTYTESVTVNKAVSIMGNDPDNPGDTRTVDATGFSYGFYIPVAVTWATIRGFEIKNASDYGIRSEGANNSIMNNIVSNVTGATYGFGIWVGGENDASDAAVQYNEVRNNRIGIQVGLGGFFGSTGATITYNSIHDNTTYGLVNAGATGIVNAEYNWWGSACPTTFDATISGSVNHVPWFANAGMTDDSSTISTTFITVSSGLADRGIVSNIGDVTACNYTSFPSLSFEKRTNGADPTTALAKITFNSAMNLWDTETQTFLLNLDTKMEQSNYRIALDARTSEEFRTHAATLVFYNLPPGLTLGQLIVRNDDGTILDASTIVSGFVQDPVTHNVTFNVAHFTRFDIDPTFRIYLPLVIR